MSSLRAQLIARLAHCITEDLRTRAIEVVADECLRQMEWARRDYKTWRPVGGGNEGVHYVYDSLTLAPEDWQP